jgi:hypothetical protein
MVGSGRAGTLIGYRRIPHVSTGLACHSVRNYFCRFTWSCFVLANFLLGSDKAAVLLR